MFRKQRKPDRKKEKRKPKKEKLKDSQFLTMEQWKRIIITDRQYSWYNLENGNPGVDDYPEWFFPKVLRMDFAKAIRSKDVFVQNFSVVPRHWFIDAYFRCENCREEFCWTALEQKYWFEGLRFWIDSHPTLCPQCSKTRRTVRALERDYGENIRTAVRRDASAELKRNMIETLDKLERLSETPLSKKKLENRELLQKQLEKEENRCKP